MKLVAYNTHYGLGKDGRTDLSRIADTVRGADVIALQEVERNYWPDGEADQPAALAARLPDYYWVYGPAFDVDDSERRPDGSVLNRRCQHGVMILSKTPILSCRPHVLPKADHAGDLNMQMGALEGVIDSPFGHLRVYSVHFGHLYSPERQQQARHLRALLQAAPGGGGAWSGPNNNSDRDWSAGRAPPPMPAAAVLLGDFNMEPDTPEYGLMTAPEADQEVGTGFVDAWRAAGGAADGGITFPDALGGAARRIDYCFLSSALADRLGRCWVDEAAQGSDHQPVWVELGE